MRVRDQTRGKSDSGIWLAGLSVAALAGFAAKPAMRAWIQSAVKKAVVRIMKDPYGENLWELISASRRPGPQTIVETNLRARRGGVIQRPLGSPNQWPNFEKLVFNFAQVATSPAPHDAPVETGVALGPAATRPLRLPHPIIVSAMAYGASLSAKVKVALARGAALAGGASNAGEGLVLPEERRAARHLIMQFNRATWSKEPELLRQADMVEIHYGQGAAGGVGGIVMNAKENRRLRSELGIPPGEEPIIYSTHPELSGGKKLVDLVDYLRELTDGVPIGVKLAPGKQLEADLDICVEAGVDVVALDGAQAATHGSPPILQDDFGVPTLHALVRATRALDDVRDRVSLIVGGGLYTPGDFLKAIALGADAVYIGTVALFSVSHGQVFESLPWEPPTQVVFYEGHQAERFDPNEGAKRLANYLRACVEEIEVAVRSMGKTSLYDVSREDLMALDPHTADVCGVPLSYRTAEVAEAVTR